METTNVIMTTEPADIIIVITNTIDVQTNRTELTWRDFAICLHSSNPIPAL